MKVLEADEPLSAAEREELERLRLENAELRRARGERQPPATQVHPSRGADHRAWRWTATGVLLVLVAVLAFSSVLARYARSEVLDTDRYVQTVTPLAADPVMQTELTNQIVTVLITVVALLLVELVARPALLTHDTPQDSTT